MSIFKPSIISLVTLNVQIWGANTDDFSSLSISFISFSVSILKISLSTIIVRMIPTTPRG